ncbi:hypothetical protein HUT03_02915 [Candidatus Liberibacter africanus]|uniref:Uncharacterized protein n=1 Tax=Candidatus Liberibacter africanus PTSAPSY TaxID=1277257 RepID=A0A0G3I2U2_LIBAF|nr:hypothetical protein [Candidatus Liberibacter africanus]AKK20209.1 hypothetical protein G293_02905 [Candidatus Liberibacter africanus PTSAPSY]QTP63988.1 hypothetical protein HUT03_02915 [Candidatus Liberibacter africanus]
MLVSETNNNYPLGNYPKTENPTNATQKQGILPQTENSSPDSVQQKTFLEKAKECTKEAAISMIPVYGTIQEFKFLFMELFKNLKKVIMDGVYSAL